MMAHRDEAPGEDDRTQISDQPTTPSEDTTTVLRGHELARTRAFARVATLLCVVGLAFHHFNPGNGALHTTMTVALWVLAVVCGLVWRATFVGPEDRFQSAIELAEAMRRAVARDLSPALRTRGQALDGRESVATRNLRSGRGLNQ